MREALYVTVLGMSLVFLALTIVLVVTLTLERLFRVRVKSLGCEPEGGAASTTEEDDTQVAAAIAAALSALDAESDVDVPPRPLTRMLSLEHASPGWKAASRLASMR